MGGTDQRLAVFPTRMSLMHLQQKHKAAEKGKSLIKKKADAIQMKHKEIAGELYAKKQELDKLMENAYFLLTKAEFYGGDMRLAKQQARKMPLSVRIELESVAGMSIPVYRIPETVEPMYFVGSSGKLISECRMQFIACLSLMVEIASKQVSFTLLDQMLLATNRRVNALEHMLIPKLENTIAYIQSELDEQDREDFFRLKKVQQTKKAA
ncbi:V-type H+-transporting ATPase subunit D [Nematocida sp. AWRm80]|nr:V-type H+-transporting ATPase subunit D [Nematocida sp. AWRm80]KAI5181549.1 V-type H+-transporting ATPase subunit D [Nematocida sp. AWRm80]